MPDNSGLKGDFIMNNFNPKDESTWPYVLTFNQHISPITGISKPKLLSMAANGEIPVKKIRGRWIISKDVFLNWLNAV